MKSISNNNSEKGLLPQPYPFAGTILESSYTPLFFYDKKDSTQKESSIITTALGYAILPQIAYSSLPFWRKVFDSIKEIWKNTKEKIFDITKQNDLEWRQNEFNDFVAESKKKYEKYVHEHDDIYCDIVKDIDTINRKKILMKDYYLKELYVKLQKAGVDCDFNDLVIEHIDSSQFPINEMYDTIKVMQLSIEKDSNTINRDLFALIQLLQPGAMIRNRIRNGKAIKDINNKMSEATLKQKSNATEMISDLVLINDTELAFDNIAKIYNDIMETLQPIMSDILDKLSSRYNNRIDNMPPHMRETLRLIKDIFKDFSEVTIVPSKTASDMKKELLEKSNELSKKHYDLKFMLLKVSQEYSPEAA